MDTYGQPKMICVNSPNEMALTKAAQKRLWEAFNKSGTSHSSLAATLPYIIRRCEQEKVAYVLEAVPGTGYYIKRLFP